MECAKQYTGIKFNNIFICISKRIISERIKEKQADRGNLGSSNTITFKTNSGDYMERDMEEKF